ncbi:MAG TPA: hypothetical protein VF069_22180 [Streptosporangiaceae bacterium]
MQARSAAIIGGRLAAYAMVAAAVAILANTAVGSCQGGDQGAGPAAAGARTGLSTGGPAGIAGQGGPAGLPPGAAAGGQAGGQAGAPAASAAPRTPALPPQVAVAQLRALAGKWLSTAKSKDYFVFRADGTGAWMVRGRALWQGEVIPTGRGAYRLAWQTTMPNNAAYWHVTLLDGGRRLLFDGTRKTYRKV